jgi:hypothetical protein
MNFYETWAPVIVSGVVGLAGAFGGAWYGFRATVKASEYQRKSWLKQHCKDLLEMYENLDHSSVSWLLQVSAAVSKFRQKYLQEIQTNELVHSNVEDVVSIANLGKSVMLTPIGFDTLGSYLDIMPENLRRQMITFRKATILFESSVNEVEEFQRENILPLYLRGHDKYGEAENRTLKMYQNLLKVCLEHETSYKKQLLGFRDILRETGSSHF